MRGTHRLHRLLPSNPVASNSTSIARVNSPWESASMRTYNTDQNYKKHCINSLAPRRFQFYLRQVIFKLILVNGGWGISYEIALRWMPLDLIDDKSTLVQVTAWCRQATSHCLNQCWPRSRSPNGVTRPQWVNFMRHNRIDEMHATFWNQIFTGNLRQYFPLPNKSRYANDEDNIQLQQMVNEFHLPLMNDSIPIILRFSFLLH